MYVFWWLVGKLNLNLLFLLWWEKSARKVLRITTPSPPQKKNLDHMFSFIIFVFNILSETKLLGYNLNFCFFPFFQTKSNF